MDLVIRGRSVSDADLDSIRSLIAAEGHRGRSQLSLELCRQWNWKQSNGKLKEASCRAFLLRLHDLGLIVLPMRIGGTRRERRAKPAFQQLALFEQPSTISSFPTAIQWRLANSGPEFFLYKDLIQSHHYLGYCRQVGHRMRYVAYSNGQAIACLGWAAAAWKVAPRDRFIGWSPAQRRKNLHLVINNTRFLILPRIPHLASHLLAGNLRRLRLDWHKAYGYSPALAETFVDDTRFKGTCYKAANWTCVGLTQGRGKYDRDYRRAQPIKSVYVYPLDKKFRQILTDD